MRLIAAITVALALCGCGTDDAQMLQPTNRFEVARQVCELQRNIPNSIIATQILNRSIVYGPVTQQIVSDLKSVWSSIYATKKSVVTRTKSGLGFCISQPVPGYFLYTYQNCERTTSTDISTLYGVGRADNRQDAESVARGNCRSIVDQYVKATNADGDDDFESSDFTCERLAVQQCF
jgi:hypothetical protein